MSDPRRRAPKGVRFEESRSGSSRASTVGGSSTSSGHSGSQYTPEYNVGALEETLRTTIRQLDDWKKRTIEAEKAQDASKARITALELSNKTQAEDKNDLEKQLRDLKKELDAAKKDNSKLQRKLDKYESRSEPSSPDSGKLRRSDSKKSKDSEVDEDHERLKRRLNRTGETPSETNPPKPPSSSRSKRTSGRRNSISSTAEKPPYLEGWGPGASAAPVSPTTSSSRRPPSDYVMANIPVTSSSIQAPVLYASTPRSTAMPHMRPTVEYTTYMHPHQTVNYPYHPVPGRQ